MTHKPRMNEQIEANQTFHLKKIMPGFRAALDVKDVLEQMGERGTLHFAYQFMRLYGRRFGKRIWIITPEDMEKYRTDGTLMEFLNSRPRGKKPTRNGVYIKKGCRSV